MAFSLTVSSRTVNPDGSIQYQFADGTGVMFPNAAIETEWSDQSDIETTILRQVQRVAVNRTLANSGNPGVTALFDIADATGNVLKVNA